MPARDVIDNFLTSPPRRHPNQVGPHWDEEFKKVEADYSTIPMAVRLAVRGKKFDVPVSTTYGSKKLQYELKKRGIDRFETYTPEQGRVVRINQGNPYVDQQSTARKQSPTHPNNLMARVHAGERFEIVVPKSGIVRDAAIKNGAVDGAPFSTLKYVLRDEQVPFYTRSVAGNPNAVKIFVNQILPSRLAHASPEELKRANYNKSEYSGFAKDVLSKEIP
jgi:hypothetical protein